MKCPHPVTRSSKEAYDPNKVFRHTCAVTGLAPRSPDSVQWTCPVQFHAIRYPTQPRPAANWRASESLGSQPWRPIPANGTEHYWMQWTCPSNPGWWHGDPTGVLMSDERQTDAFAFLLVLSQVGRWLLASSSAILLGTASLWSCNLGSYKGRSTKLALFMV